VPPSPRRETLAGRSLRLRLEAEERNPTLLEVAVMAVGVRRGTEALCSLEMWAVARRRNGGERPTVDQLAAAEAVSVPSAYKHQQLLREVFGDDDGIEAVANIVDAIIAGAKADLASRKEGRDLKAGLLLLGPLRVPWPLS
jgi:hypothetical protein